MLQKVEVNSEIAQYWENPRQCSANESYGGRLKHCFLHSRKGPAGFQTIPYFNFDFHQKQPALAVTGARETAGPEQILVVQRES
jgi:hypothetical protein